MSFIQQLDQIRGKAIDFLFPSRCIGCGKEGDFICLSCRRTLPTLIAPLCEKCGEPLPWEGLCLKCERWKLEIDGIRSRYRFEGLIRQAIHQFKYNHFVALALPLARLLNEYLQHRAIPVEVLVPVPLHPRRLRERGYNQSGKLAKELGKLACLPVEENSLRRLKDTIQQVRANAESRYNNVTGAFVCIDQRLQDKQVLLIDDVCTTGATLDSCASALKKNGVRSVWGITIAREV